MRALIAAALALLIAACGSTGGSGGAGGAATPQASVQPRPADATNKPAPSKDMEDPYGYGY